MMKGEGDGRRGARRTRAPGTRGNRCGPSEGVGGCGRLEAARRPGGGLSQNRLPHAGSGCGATGAATWQPKSGAALGPPLRGLSAGSPGRSPPVLEPGVKPTPGRMRGGRHMSAGRGRGAPQSHACQTRADARARAHRRAPFLTPHPGRTVCESEDAPAAELRGLPAKGLCLQPVVHLSARPRRSSWPPPQASERRPSLTPDPGAHSDDPLEKTQLQGGGRGRRE